jgi:hypothetical protein
MDFLYVTLTIAFFAVSWYFVRLCASFAPAEEEKK